MHNKIIAPNSEQNEEIKQNRLSSLSNNSDLLDENSKNQPIKTDSETTKKSLDEEKLDRIISVLCSCIDKFRLNVLEMARDFGHAYINVPKKVWGNDTTISRDEYKSELQKLQKEEEEANYLKLYVDGCKMMKRINGVKPRTEAPFNLLRESLVKSSTNYAKRFVELCKVLTPPPVYPPEEEMTEEERQRKIDSLLEAANLENVANEFANNDNEIEESKHSPIFAGYTTDMAITYNMEDESSIIKELETEDFDNCRMIAIDSQYAAGDITASKLYEILPSYQNVTALYFSMYFFYYRWR